MLCRSRLFLVDAALVELVVPGAAQAAGGNYLFDGGAPAEQVTVHSALEVSGFDWGLVPATVTIHIARGHGSQATPGQIWLDADLLDAGRFSWGIIQHEYAHQVDFFLLHDADRASLAPVIGGSMW